MADSNVPPPGGPQNPQGGSGDVFSEQVKHSPVSARVPEKLARGVLTTGALVLDGPQEFVIDFVQALTRPYHIASRVVMTPNIMAQFIHAVRENFARHEQRFGPVNPLPKNPSDRRPSLQEIYEEFKLSDDMMSGVYANAVMVGHSASEFFFDFITAFYPTSAVSSRVLISAQQVPRMIEALSVAYSRYQQRIAQQQQNQQQPPPPNPPQGLG